MPKADHTGERFGKLTVIRLAGVKNHRSRWLCRCDCGNEREVVWSNLQSGNTKSCGCRERMRHGYACNGNVAPEYKIWLQMRDRCRNPNTRSYRWYGARGVKVCERWNDFNKFMEDMGPRPKDGWWSIDRIDCEGDYCPENCRWATRKQQRENQRPWGSLEAVQ